MTTSLVYDACGNRKYLNLSERQAFLEVAASAEPEVMTFCSVLAYTGARISEVLALTPMRIDFEGQAIVFECLKKRQKGQYRPVPVPEELLKVLDRVHGIKDAQQSAPGVNRPLWPWCRTTGWSRVKGVMDLAGIEGIHASPRGLRHSLGVSAIQAGVPLNMVQKWLGHTHMHTTAIYTNATGPEERQFANQLWRGFVEGKGD
ncbi:tyrosine-type recombinase/integrase [Kordiimonas marina]|uniref:tyrosine-type recombinase/integrase n=1 Tax=Kordiimonas marina TaxID=2872312 RepID=UPI001FF20FD2|nr:site-specific integrase [Kordiimonas marina]MCJ9430743.1 site-specific integrase [Kordiimonas marina]